jgi:hypothetical protein
VKPQSALLCPKGSINCLYLGPGKFSLQLLNFSIWYNLTIFSIYKYPFQTLSFIRSGVESTEKLCPESEYRWQNLIKWIFVRYLIYLFMLQYTHISSHLQQKLTAILRSRDHVLTFTLINPYSMAVFIVQSLDVVVPNSNNPEIATFRKLETLVHIPITRRYIPEDCNINTTIRTSDPTRICFRLPVFGGRYVLCWVHQRKLNSTTNTVNVGSLSNH